MVEDGRQGLDPGEAWRRLQARRRALKALERGLRGRGPLAGSQQQVSAELSSYDNHPAELGTDTWQRGQAVGMAADLHAQVQQLDAALQRLAEGRYGRCERCGQIIPAARLRVLPEARCCQSCQRQVEAEEAAADERRRVAMAQCTGLLGGTQAPAGLEEADRAGATDDAWQALAAYGSSDSPAEAQPLPDPQPSGAVQGVEAMAGADGRPLGTEADAALPGPAAPE